MDRRAVDDLASRARVPFVLAESRSDVHERFADDLWAEISGAREAGREISLIVPIGASDHYPLLAKRINEAQLPLDHVTFFGMDEWLDWQGRPFSTMTRSAWKGAFTRSSST